MSPAPDGQFLRGLAFSAGADRVLAVWDDRGRHTWDDMDVLGAMLGDRFLRPPRPLVLSRETRRP